MTFLSSIFNTPLQLLSHLSEVVFITPWFLALAPLPWVFRLLIKPIKKKTTPLLAPHIMKRLKSMKEAAILEPNTRQYRLPWVAVLLWFLLVLACMRPVLFLAPTSFNTSGKDVILAVDLSGSMEKNDMVLNGDRVDRLTLVKSVVADFIKKRQGDRLGLVVFGSQAFIQSPLTYDLNTVNQLLQESEIGMAGTNTAIGDAIGLTLKHLTQQANKSNHTVHKPVLILLTDGSNTDGAVEPLEAAKQAKKMGLKIYTIGIGQSKTSGLGAFFNNRSMDIDTLQKISKESGGQFFLAENASRLNQIYGEINRLEKSEYQVNQYRLRTELYPWPLGLALLLSFFIAMGRLKSSHHTTHSTQEEA